MIDNLTVVMPDPPNPATDGRDIFPSKATAFTLAMKQLGDQLKPIIPQINAAIDSASTVEAQVATATTKAAEASASADAAASSAAQATTNGAAQVTLAAAQVTLATTHAGNAAASATASAASRSAIDNRIYPGTYAADPATAPDGTAPQNGHVYFTTAGVAKVYGGGVWSIVPGASAADLANATDQTKGAALVGHDATSVAGVFKDRMFRRVANVAALRALDKTKYTAAKVATYAADTGAASSEYLYDSTDTTTAESLPYVIVATDGGRWKLSSPMMPAPQDALPVGLITRDRGQIGPEIPRQLGLSADNAQLSLELPLHIGTRRNVWQYTEDLASNRYSTINAAKNTDTIFIDGITLTRLSASNFYSNINTNFVGLGLTPFVVNERYLMSYFVVNRAEAEAFFWMRGLTNANFGHGAKLATTRMRRVWQVVQATATNNSTAITTPTTALGGEASGNYWYQMGSAEGGAMEVYLGGFSLEKLNSNIYKDGVAMIGDSTMAGSSGKVDLTNGGREVSTWLGALLNVNVFNRAVGGERTDSMDARWAADITPLAVNCKYAIIQGGINDIAQDRVYADIQGSITSMVNKAIAAGLIPVLFTCTPTTSIGSVPSREAARLALNTWLKATFPRVIDIASVVADPHNPASLRRAKGWFGDGVHYGTPAKRAIAAYVAQWSGWDFITPSPYQAIPVATYSPPGSALTHNGLQVVGPREAGWTAGTGTPNKGAFAADTATAVQAAQRVLALENALRAHGLID